jgi:carbamoyl-phosphate synthase small subunit
MRTVEDIIALMGGPEPAATRLGIGTEALRKWRQARAIPAKHWPAVIEATRLTLDDLPRGGDTTRKTRTETSQVTTDETAPEGATAVLVLADGSAFWGRGFGAQATTVAEICFNTSMTGYQEVLTDPSYAGQTICFTFPHIGNVGANPEDIEAITPAAGA